MSSENVKDVKLTGLQKARARKMIASWTDVPQFQLESEVNCEAMMAFRKKQDYKLSYTAILAKAAADTLAEFPRLNSSWAGDHIVEHEDINIGIAVDTKRGLLVPVISNADRKSLEEIMEELNAMKEKSSRGNFTMEEMQGGTFTISNLGMYRVNSFGSIVNAPEAGILAVGKMQKTVAVGEDNDINVVYMMHPTLTVDHRVTDGATGAKFLTALVERLEHPDENF